MIKSFLTSKIHYLKSCDMNKLAYICITVLIGLSLSGVACNVIAAESISVNKAPDFTLQDLSGKNINLSSFRGKTILLNFWATWCPYCRKERDHLNSVYNEYKDKGLIIISVATDNSIETVREFMKKVPADYIVLSDKDKEVSNSYKVRGLPTSFLIDREGVVQEKIVGFREWTNTGSKKHLDGLIGK